MGQLKSLEGHQKQGSCCIRTMVVLKIGSKLLSRSAGKRMFFGRQCLGGLCLGFGRVAWAVYVETCVCIDSRCEIFRRLTPPRSMTGSQDDMGLWDFVCLGCPVEMESSSCNVSCMTLVCCDHCDITPVRTLKKTGMYVALRSRVRNVCSITNANPSRVSTSMKADLTQTTTKTQFQQRCRKAVSRR